ncbi:tRNA-dihydrouridine synthase [bacterium]|nr:tRNA-dihydrouridine synthase [bacterium]
MCCGDFGCPVNKVVSKNGGSSLLKDCPLLTDTAAKIVKAIDGQVPVTGKIRIGWDQKSINAPPTSAIYSRIVVFRQSQFMVAPVRRDIVARLTGRS